MKIASLLSLAWRDLRGGGRSLWVFCACLALGVTLIAASGGILRQVNQGLLADTRMTFGGDLEVRERKPLPQAQLDWMGARGEVSLLIEFRTMLITAKGAAHLVELQSADANYPLYGAVALDPPSSLGAALAWQDGAWGAAIDRVLAERLGLKLGDRVELGTQNMEVRALIMRQPDRSLRADWSGPPVLIAGEALTATGLLQPGSRPAYRYRVRTAQDPVVWRAAFARAFPAAEWEAQTAAERSERLSTVLGQVGSGLLLIGFSALFIGGLGVFNSVQAYLQGKLATIAVLQAIGLRDRGVATVYVLQVLILAGAASLFGTVLGGALALVGSGLVGARFPVAGDWANLALPLAIAWSFGVLTALTFALPPLGRALSVSPAVLFRGLDGTATRTPASWWKLTACCALVVMSSVLLAVPDRLFGIGFVVAIVVVLAALEGLVRSLRAGARRLTDHPVLTGRFALRLALSNLYRPGSPLRPTLLSLGSALTLLVASTLVVGALLQTIDETIPERSPALAFYDVGAAQKEAFRALVEESPSLQRLDLAPLVLGRLGAVNGEVLRDSADPERALEARDEHKLSYLQNNFDHVVIDRGAWWPPDYAGPPLVAMEDREADQLGLVVGDRLRFEIMGEAVDAELVAIYRQQRFQGRMWLEGIFSEGALDPFITRYVGMAYLDPDEAVAAQNRIAAQQPNVVTVLTANLLNEARSMLGRAATGLAVIAAVSSGASLLVLVSVVAASRVQQMTLATLLHTLGARVSLIRRSLQFEYLLLALLTSAFAFVAGSAIAWGILTYRLGLEIGGVLWLGGVAAVLVSAASLGLGGHFLLRQFRLSPARLLRAGA